MEIGYVLVKRRIESLKKVIEANLNDKFYRIEQNFEARSKDKSGSLILTNRNAAVSNYAALEMGMQKKEN